MARPKKEFPRPGKRERDGGWRIYWRDGENTYEISVGKVSESEAEAHRLEIELALRTDD
ncbi:MAG: hypothetical protein ACLFWL_12680 [Candidatus Brocadiia bacterium]